MTACCYMLPQLALYASYSYHAVAEHLWFFIEETKSLVIAWYLLAFIASYPEWAITCHSVPWPLLPCFDYYCCIQTVITLSLLLIALSRLLLPHLEAIAIYSSITLFWWSFLMDPTLVWFRCLYMIMQFDFLLPLCTLSHYHHWLWNIVSLTTCRLELGIAITYFCCGTRYYYGFLLCFTLLIAPCHEPFRRRNKENHCGDYFIAISLQ